MQWSTLALLFLSRTATKTTLFGSAFSLSTVAARPFARTSSSSSSQRTMTATSTISTSTSSETENDAYKVLVKKLTTITQLQRAKSVLGYDQLVFMPEADATSVERGAQLAAMAEVIHEKTTDASLLELLKDATSDPAVVENADAQRLLELETKSFEENSRIPSELAGKMASLSASAYSAWVKARTNDDFDSFVPVLQDCFDTAMQAADAKRGDKDIPVYTQMLDEFEMGMPQQRIDEIFAQIQTALVPLITKVLASPHAPSKDALNGNFPVDSQKEISSKLVTAIGFDDSLGRIDVSVHPFTTSFSPSDVRITSRFRNDEWYQGLAGTLHEGGHAIYEQNLKSSALSIDTALSMGAHESQSLFWERHVGLSRPFWKWATPLLQDTFDGFDFTAEQVYGAVNAVSPSLIRVEADELTYPLHVILRYNIETDVIGGKLKVQDIAQRWKDDMKELLDMDVPSDAEGCLQDVHWSALAFGYFPTYLIGSATAAQLAHYCHQDIPDMDEHMERGEFGAIKAWLTDKIHRHGKRYPSLDAMLEDQLGEKLNPEYFIEYLTNKYSDLYKLEK